MTPLFPARRRAEHFDSLVEGDSLVSGGRADVDRSSSDLLELVGALRAVPEPQARPEFISDLRERLMLAAAIELTPVPAAARQRDDVARLTIKPSRTRRERRVGIALGAVAIIGATTSMAVASQSAIPGDALYPVKRAIENTQAGFAVGDDAKGATVLGNASTRLDEADKLAHRGGSGNATLVTHTINDFTQQFTDGSNSLLADFESNGNQGSIGQIHSNAQDSMDELSGLDALIPTGGGSGSGGWSAAHDAVLNAAQTVFSIDAQAVNLCPDCRDGLLQVPAQLLAGATEGLTDTTNNLADGALGGTQPPSDAPATQPAHQHNGGKGHGRPSGLNPPETPIQLPTAPSDDTTNGLGNVLPSGGNHNQGGGTSNGGKGGKGKPVDLTPVTDAVTQAVNGVVAGVTGVLAGLTGGGH